MVETAANAFHIALAHPPAHRTDRHTQEAVHKLEQAGIKRRKRFKAWAKQRHLPYQVLFICDSHSELEILCAPNIAQTLSRCPLIQSIKPVNN